MPVAVVCVMGLPGAGKSTLCEQMTKSSEFQELIHVLDSKLHSMEVHWISFDHIESNLMGDRVEFDPIVWRNARAEVERMVADIRAHDTDPSLLRVVLLDDNFYYSSMRRRFKPNGIIFIDRSLEVCLRNNILPRSSHPVPNEVIKRMASLIELPKEANECPVLTLKGGECIQAVIQAQNFWLQVHQSAIKNTAELVTSTNPITYRERTLNEFESRLRHAIGRAIAGNPIPQDLMRMISSTKRGTLERLKKYNSTHASGLSDICDQLEAEFVAQLVTLI